MNDRVLWNGRLNEFGYGTIGKHLAHRRLWERDRGPIPRGLCLLHKCDNPQCVNLDHLFLGTQQDNIADMISKGRHRGVPGERHHRAKLTDNDVREIRSLLRMGFSRPDIARRFCVCRETIYRIADGSGWKHVESAP